MDTRYTYLFRKLGEQKISCYFVPLRGQPVSLNYILNMLARNHSDLKKFQIGVKKQTQNGEIKNWSNNIYVIYDDNQPITFKPNEIPLNKNFELLYPVTVPIEKIINRVIFSNEIVR